MLWFRWLMFAPGNFSCSVIRSRFAHASAGSTSAPTVIESPQHTIVTDSPFRSLRRVLGTRPVLVDVGADVAVAVIGKTSAALKVTPRNGRYTRAIATAPAGRLGTSGDTS